MAKYLFSFIISIIMLFSDITCVSAQTTETDSIYQERLMKYMEVSGGMAAAKAIVPQIIEMEKQQFPQIPDSFWDDITQKFNAKIGNRLVELNVPIYQKYLTIDDLNKIIEFYESSVGKKLSKNLPTIATESMETGKQLGKEIMAELMLRLQEI